MMVKRFEIKDAVTNQTILVRWWLGGRWILHHFLSAQSEASGHHDHSWAYWTLPLNPFGYMEQVKHADGSLSFEHVPGWCWTRKAKEHTHRIIHPFWSLLYIESDGAPNALGFWPEG